MTRFAYRARDDAGVERRGRLDADDARAVADSLRERGWVVVSIDRPSGRGEDRGAQRSWFRRLRSMDAEILLRQLATLLRTGTALREALELLAARSEKRRCRKVCRDVAESVATGASLAESVASTRAFDPVVVHLLEVGERSGNLDVVASRAAELLESRRNLRNSLVTSLSYPAIVVVASIAVTAYMMTGVIPEVAKVLRGFGRDVPTMTRMLIEASDFVSRQLVNFCIGGLVLAAGLAVVATIPALRVALDRGLLAVPIVGRMLRSAGTATMSETFALLLRSGITVLDALETLRRVPRNRYLGQRLAFAREHVLGGGALADCFDSAAVHGPLLGPMVAVGERCGALDDVLDEAARLEKRQLRGAVRRFAAWVEPALIISVGGIVGFVYLAFFLAIFSFSGGLG